MKSLNTFFFCLFSFALLLLNSCSNVVSPQTNNESIEVSDGSAGSFSLELNDMGDAGIQFFNANQNVSTTRSTTQETILQDTIINNITIILWHYDSIYKGWVYGASGTIGQGSVGRHDTIWLYDKNDNPVKYPSMTAVSYYKHVRSVNGTYQNVFDYRLDVMVSIIQESQDTFFIHNGTITGEYNNNKISETVITNVKRRFNKGIILPWLSYPSDGTIYMDRPFKTTLIEFGGAQSAKATVTRKSDNKTWIIIINIKTGQETDEPFIK